ncbi:MAG: glycosyl transferase family 9 [Gammaproteobacteria bacterium]|jgi:ADP-heptose:LPS heptosyltransferase|nr:glycosyl transferase family 9 [Gammaproteobacteria bacterium]
MTQDANIRFLCILPERLGDIIFCTPAINLLAELKPNAQIDILSAAPLASAVLANNPVINRIHICPNPRQLQPLSNLYDRIFCFHANSKTKAFVKKIGQDCHFGHAAPNRKHQSQMAVNAVAQALLGHTDVEDKPYTLYPAIADKERVQTLLQQYIDLDKPPVLIGCHIGCSKTVKNGFKFWKPKSKLISDKSWELARFTTLIQALYQRDKSIRILLTGTAAEKSLLKSLFKEPNVINLLGKTSVLETTVLMSYLDLFLSIDTGALHIACATEVPLIDLLRTPFVESVGPFPLHENRHVIAENSMNDITVEAVLEKIIKILDKNTHSHKAEAC